MKEEGQVAGNTFRFGWYEGGRSSGRKYLHVLHGSVLRSAWRRQDKWLVISSHSAWKYPQIQHEGERTSGRKYFHILHESILKFCMKEEGQVARNTLRFGMKKEGQVAGNMLIFCMKESSYSAWRRENQWEGNILTFDMNEDEQVAGNILRSDKKEEGQNILWFDLGKENTCQEISPKSTWRRENK